MSTDQHEQANDSYYAAVALRSPSTGELIDTYSPAREPVVIEAVRRARIAAIDWSAYTPRVRSTVMMQWVNRLRRISTRLAEVEAIQRGISLAQARMEVGEALDIFEFYAGAARTGTVAAGGEIIPNHTSHVEYRPLGTVGVILPWNYPIMMLAWRAGPALAAGNAVVVKPAEETPGSTSLAAAEAAQCAVPLFCVAGDRETGALLSEAGLDGYGFTGSKRAGIQVARAAAPAPVSLELGGNCPAIFCDDAPAGSEDDLVAKAMHNAGQSCAGPSRFIVTSEQAADRLRAAVSRYVSSTPVISFKAHAIVALKLACAMAQERDIVMGEVTQSNEQIDGYFVQPAIVTLPINDPSSLRTRETFGPVVTLEIASSLNEAIESALDPACDNDLAASVWTSSLATADRLTRALAGQVGEVWINCALQQTAELPHSSRGGLDLSTAALDQYRRPTTITASRG